MKDVKYITLSFLLALASCATTERVTVETKIPGEVVFPVVSPRVVVVNNAAVQPPDNGVEYLLGNKVLRGYVLSKDSAYQVFTNALGEFLDGTGFFEEVFIYNEPVRTDAAFLQSRPIDPVKAGEIADDVNADALILADRLLFQLSQQIVGSDAYFSSIEVFCHGDFSIYSAAKGEITHTFNVVDSLKFNDYVGSDTTLFLRKIPRSLLLASAMRVAEKVGEKCAPHWEYSERLFYTGFDSRMRTAYAYAKKGRWPQAVEQWTDIYNNSDRKRRGMAAVNIATAEEINNSYTSALSWVDRALNAYSEENPGKVEEETKYAAEYRERLERLRRGVLD